jgi:hypothetical protein
MDPEGPPLTAEYRRLGMPGDRQTLDKPDELVYTASSYKYNA